MLPYSHYLRQSIHESACIIKNTSDNNIVEHVVRRVQYCHIFIVKNILHNPQLLIIEIYTS